MGLQTARMAGGGARRGGDGVAMPSWSTSTPPETAATPRETDTASAGATPIERVRRLLVQLLTAREPGDPPRASDK
jgi:hypothetical protein